jgi:hypothetical protein
MIQQEFHFFNTIAVFFAAAVPIYLSLKLKDKNLKKLTMLLAAFVVIHGVYHASGSLDWMFLAKGILDPISAATLLVFGLYYFLMIKTKREVKT